MGLELRDCFMQWYTTIVARVPPMTPAIKKTTAVVATAIPRAAPLVNESALPEGKEKLGHHFKCGTMCTVVTWYKGVVY